MHFIGLNPCAALPCEFFADSAAHFAIVSELALLYGGFGDADKLIFIIVIKRARAVRQRVAVQVIGKGVSRWKVHCYAVCVHPSVTILGNRSERVVSIGNSEMIFCKRGIGIQNRVRCIHRHVGRCAGRCSGHCQRAFVGDGRQFVQSVHVKSLNQRIVRAPIQIARRIVGIAKLFLETVGCSASFFSGCRFQFANVVVGITDTPLIREPPETAFRSWVDGGSSVFGVAGFRAAPAVGVFLTVNLLRLTGFGSVLVLSFAFQAAIRGNSFNRTICSERARL